MTPITPRTRVGEFLDAYPELEERLVQLAPAFKKLKNPVLRRTVARVATLAQAARVGGLTPHELVEALRQAAGQGPLDGASEREATSEVSDTNPWIEAYSVVCEVDAEAVLATGGHPLEVVIRHLRELGDGASVAVLSEFRPVPLVEAVAKQGFASHSRQTEAGRFQTLIARARGGPTRPG